MRDKQYLQIALSEYLHALSSGSEPAILNKKCKLLWDAANLFEVVSNYIVLDRNGIAFDFGSCVIPRGTKLYRIREYSDSTDFSDKKEWRPSPNKLQNRANAEGKEALYLGSTETVCILETHQKPKTKYVLGEYECIDDIRVGGFLKYDEREPLHELAGIVLNALLIAPSRNDKNKDLFEFLERRFGRITLDNLSSINECILENGADLVLPYKFALLNQRDKLYCMTNELCEIIEKQYPNGIRYSSCFMPFETPGIECTDYNLALYSSGIQKVRFIGYAVKTLDLQNADKFNATEVAKAILGEKDDE